MKIEIHNDGLETFQSWEAKAVLNSEVDNSWSNLSIEAYGSTEQEARANLGKQIKTIISDLTQISERNENKK